MASVFRVPRDDDPCLNSASVESILPLIPERSPGGTPTAGAAGPGVASGSSPGGTMAGTAATGGGAGRGGGGGNQGTQVGKC